jgi:hypothetical protein
MVAVWLVIIGSVLAFALVRNHIAKPTSMPLSETEFLQKFEANQIERATVSYNPQSPAVAKISGTYYRTDKDGNIIKSEKEVPFIVENALITPNLERKLVRSDKIVVNTPNPMLTVVAYNLLFLGGFGMVILLLLGIIIYVVSRVIKRPVGVPVPPVQKPDRFWRWFAVAVFAMIAIPFLISIVGLLAAIAIPNFVKARAQAQENARRAAAQMATNQLPGLNLSFGPVIERILNDPDDDPRNSFLDLDTGTVFDDPVPPPTGNMSVEMRIGFTIGAMDSLLRAIRERRVDLVGDASGNSLAGCDLVALPVASEQFDSALTDTILWRQNETALTNAGEDFVILHATNTPATWLFKTREGRSGILQITGFTENPRGVKIRYKLVQNENTNTVSAHPKLPTSAFQIRLVADDSAINVPTDTLTNYFDGTHFERLRLLKDVFMDGTAVERAGWHVVDGQTNFVIGLTEAGSQQFEALTAASLKRRIAVVFEGRILFAPVINSRISTRSLDLVVGWDRNDVERTMNGLNQMKNPVVNLRFGPEQESVLPTIKSNWTFLNLRANRLIATSPPDFESRAFHDWQRKNGADLVATVSDVVATGEKLPSLIGYGMATAPAFANGLDNNSPADIWYNWNLMVNEPEARSYLRKPPNSAQDTYYFRTSDDTWGVLQITGFTENPRRVKIRYKLVQNSTSTNSQ